MLLAMFYIAHISLALIVVFLILIARLRTKNQLRNYFIVFLIFLLVWTVGVIARQYCIILGQQELIFPFDNLSYFGVAFLPPQMLLISIIFTSNGKKPGNGKYLLYIIPVLTQVVMWTNDYHHAYYSGYDFANPDLAGFGWYFYIHTAYSYGSLLIAIIIVLLFAVKSKGATAVQAAVILVGTLIPVIVNVAYTFGFPGFTIFSTPIAFLVTLIAYFFGALRYNMFRLTPIAMKTVIDKTSELYIVVDENMIILDYNEPFYNIFSQLSTIKKNTSLQESFAIVNKTGNTEKGIVGSIKECEESREVVNMDMDLLVGDEMHYYSMEFTPLIIENEYCACIVILRDVTQARNDMEEIKRNHAMLIERERLASLGQLMGGIAHNLKTPIMAISGRTHNMEALINECEESLGNESVTVEDYQEIAKEMREEIVNINSHMSYISEIITTVKDQTVERDYDVNSSFTIVELVRRIKILLQHELVSNGCELIYRLQIEDGDQIPGDINSILQVIDCIIINAIHAYEGAGGKIWMKVSYTPEDVIFSIRDEAGGIPQDVQDKLFKQMITTKGRDGTGLGLYISHTTIVGRYNGKMWFDSIPGKGSEFFISIPLRSNYNME